LSAVRLKFDVSPFARSQLARFVIFFALTIVAWACAHDLYLISVEPRHFTEYHRALLPIHNHELLAIQYATIATFGPGMVFGALACAVSIAGKRPPHSLRFAWTCFVPFIFAIEAAAVGVGTWARSRQAAGLPLPYPDWLYPDDTAGIAYSQSVNLSAYLGAFVLGGLYLGLLILLRSKKS
jgi:uncharacterized membrane protein YidH (DUF202 family)